MHIGDIGQAVRGPQNRELAAWQNGKRGVLLLAFKQPGANVIDTVERIKAALPALEASIPPSVHVTTIVDRTQTIRASVNDVEFTLALSIGLVVMVIFLFLRNVWATIIPSVTVPLALVGTLGAMYLFGFSLDNLSLMGLTIAVGFVVDDAIVMLENIYRHIEDGMKPMDAAIKGAGEIGFTIVSISLSLIAVFIPLLLMGGIVGRLFREFAMTVSITVLVSALVSLTLTPMMCSRFLASHQPQHGRLYRIVEAHVRRNAGVLSAHARRGAALPLRHADGVHRDGGDHRLAVRDHTEGLLPDAGCRPDHRRSPRVHRMRPSSRWRGCNEQLNDIVGSDPAVASFASQVGAGTGGQQGNDGRMFINLKPWDQRPNDGVMKVIARLAEKAKAVPGYPVVHAAGAGHQCRRPAVAHTVSVHAGRTPISMN